MAEAHETPEKRGSHAIATSLSAPLCIGATIVALTEATRAAMTASANNASLGALVLAAALTFGVTGLPFVLGAGVIALATDRVEMRDLAKALARAFAGDDEDAHVPLAGFLAAGALGLATFAAMSWGRSTSYAVGTPHGVDMTVVTLLGLVVAGGFFVAFVARALGKRLRRAEKKRPKLRLFTSGSSLALLGAAALSAALRALVPRGFVLPLVLGVGVFVVLTYPRIAARTRAVMSTRAWIGLFAVPIALGLAAVAFVDRTGTPVRISMLYGAPLSSALMGQLRMVLDRDRDGFAPRLLGGDCNDADPAIHPGAKEIALDGIDQDCSGRDAPAFTRHPQPYVLRPPELPRKPNIVLVQFDALRPDHLHFNGYPRSTSPHLDRFREDATLFTRAYTPAPSTRFALATLFTGLDVLAVPQKRGPGNDIEMLTTAPTLAGRLSDAQYDAVGWTISFVIQHAPGLGRGFREWKTPWPLHEWLVNYPVMATKTTDAVVEYLHGAPEDGSKPFFLFVHYACTHDPYGVDARWHYGSSTLDDYDSAINYCDDEFGRLLATLDARKDADRTDLIVFSDHGELMGEHGFEHHGHTLYEDAVRILLMTRLRGLAPRREVTTPVMLTDVHETVLSLVGLSGARGGAGWNLIGYVKDAPRPADAERPIFLFTMLNAEGIHYQSRGVIKGKNKAIYDMTAGTTQLFDVMDDPRESRDLAASQPALREDLASLVEAWEASTTK